MSDVFLFVGKTGFEPATPWSQTSIPKLFTVNDLSFEFLGTIAAVDRFWLPGSRFGVLFEHMAILSTNYRILLTHEVNPSSAILW